MTFKVSVLGKDGYEVTPYDMVVPENSYFESNTDIEGTNSVIRLSRDLSTQAYHVAETVDELSASANGSVNDFEDYYALVSQSAGAAPTANILNATSSNYLGSIIYARTGAGFYTATLTGKLTAGQTFIFPISKNDATLASIDTANLPNSFSINTGVDDKLTESPVCIRVFKSSEPPVLT